MVTIVEPLELSLAADRPRLEALRVRMATHIPCFPDTVEIRTALEEMPLLELLAVYTNWAHRLIPPRPPQSYGSGLSFGGPEASRIVPGAGSIREASFTTRTASRAA